MADDQSTAVAVTKTRTDIVSGNRIAPIIPTTIQETAQIANTVILAGLYPDSLKGANDKETQAKVVVAIMKGAEVGIPPITAMSTIAVINGKPSIYGDGGVALIQNSGKLEYMKVVYSGEETADDYTCTVTMKRIDQSQEYMGSFSMAEAKRARLAGKVGPWRDYPKRMLKWRAFSFCARDGFADVLSGLSIAEEAMDMPAAPPQIVGTPAALEDDIPAPVDITPTQDGVDPAKQAAFDFIRDASDLKSLMAWYTSEAPDELMDDPEVIKAYEAKRNELAA